MMSLPTTPIESDPVDVYLGTAQADIRRLLDEALDGVDLGAYDRRVIEWAKTWDQPTIVTLASLFLRARGPS
jgi:hypothetical protein